MADERGGHKADYVPSLGGAARAKKDARARLYVEERQGLTVGAAGRGSGLKYRTIGQIWTKKGVRGRWGLDPIEARSDRHNRELAQTPPRRVSLKV